MEEQTAQAPTGANPTLETSSVPVAAANVAPAAPVPIPAVPAPAATAGKTDYAVGKRVVAAILDIILLLIFFWLISAVFGKDGTTTINGRVTPTRTVPTLISLTSDLLAFLYFVLLEAYMGATLGKMVLGLKVVKVDGSKMSVGASFVRNLMRIVDCFPYFIPYLLGLIALAVNDKKQRLGDKVADTIVIHK